MSPAGAAPPPASAWRPSPIYYGTDQIDYVPQEFGGPGMDRTDPRSDPRDSVPFWLDF
jgi:hypothetical protein